MHSLELVFTNWFLIINLKCFQNQNYHNHNDQQGKIYIKEFRLELKTVLRKKIKSFWGHCFVCIDQVDLEYTD